MRILVFIVPISLFFACKEDATVIGDDLNLIGHYDFNGNSNDQTKYGNNGILFNATLTTDSFATTNSAYYFNNSSYIEIPDKDILDIRTNELTISAWIKPSITSSSYILQKSTFVNTSGQLTQGGGPFSLDIFPGTPRALIYDSDNSPIILTGTSSIKPNVWQHLALTWDGKVAYLYYNGRIEASGSFEKQILVTNGSIYIGAYKWTFPTAAFKGSIDNVRIYNRFLTTIEIQELFANYK